MSKELIIIKEDLERRIKHYPIDVPPHLIEEVYFHKGHMFGLKEAIGIIDIVLDHLNKKNDTAG